MERGLVHFGRAHVHMMHNGVKGDWLKREQNPRFLVVSFHFLLKKEKKNNETVSTIWIKFELQKCVGGWVGCPVNDEKKKKQRTTRTNRG